jgi:phosphonate transport system substrate-binding protein
MKVVLHTVILVMILGLLGAFLASCKPLPDAKAMEYVDLTNLQPLPTPINTDVRPLRVAIAAVISPQGSAESYGPLLEYLAKELGRPVEPVLRRTYGEVNDMLRTGEADLAFVCTSAYILGKRDFNMQLLVAPQVNGEKVYHAQLIVPADSQAQSLSDLRGTLFAFTDPMSFTGRMYPTYLLQQMGETPEVFFKNTIFTYSHDDAIYAVANDVADGASIDALVLDFALNRDPSLASRVRVLHTSEPFGIPPVVVGPDIRPQLRAQLQDILLNLHKDSAGQAALQAIGYEQFVLIADKEYDSAEAVESALNFFSAIEP